MKPFIIAHLYAKELNLYGDSGNVLCLQNRLLRRGIPVEIQPINIGDTLGNFDLLFIGGGQDKEMRIITDDLKRKREMLHYCVHSGKVILAICGGYQLLGEFYRPYESKDLKMSGALPFYTVGGQQRMIGNIVYETPFGKVVGFENHSGKTYLQGNLQPLGYCLRGYGNNGEDGQEGLLFQNTFCTYAHGPVLPKNPAFADTLLRRALQTDTLPPLDDEMEMRCHRQLIARYS